MTPTGDESLSNILQGIETLEMVKKKLVALLLLFFLVFPVSFSERSIDWLSE